MERTVVAREYVGAMKVGVYGGQYVGPPWRGMVCIRTVFMLVPGILVWIRSVPLIRPSAPQPPTRVLMVWHPDSGTTGR